MIRFNLLDSMFGDSQNGPERTLPSVPISNPHPAKREWWRLGWESWLAIGVTTVLVTFFIVALLRG